MREEQTYIKIPEEPVIVMTAAEARQKAEENRPARLESELRIVRAKIQGRVRDGYNSVVIENAHGVFHPAVWITLKSEGYGLRNYGDYDPQSRVEVYW